MFFKCLKLEEVNLENFTTNKIENMDYMFYKCESLKNVNLNNLKTEDNLSYDNLFCGVNEKCKIKSDEKIIRIWKNYLDSNKKKN